MVDQYDPEAERAVMLSAFPPEKSPRAYLYGKGPSLDRWAREYEGMPGPHVAINEACLLVPDAIGVIWDEDPVETIIHAVSESGAEFPNPHPSLLISDRAWVMAPRRTKRLHEALPVRHAMFQRAKHGGNRGTPPVAIDLIKEYGPHVKEIVLVGFDNFWDEALNVPWDQSQGPPSAPYAKDVRRITNYGGRVIRREHDYRTINEAICETADRHDLVLTDPEGRRWPRHDEEE